MPHFNLMTIDDYTIVPYEYTITSGVTIPILIFQLPQTFSELSTYENLKDSTTPITFSEYQDRIKNLGISWVYYKYQNPKFGYGDLRWGGLNGVFKNKLISISFTSTSDRNNFSGIITKNNITFTNNERHTTDNGDQFVAQLILYCIRDSANKYSCGTISYNQSPSLDTNWGTSGSFPTDNSKTHDASVTDTHLMTLSFGTFNLLQSDNYLKNGEAIQSLIESIPDPNDPYNPSGGDSTPGGGGGSGDIGGDTNPDDGLPTISALDSGLLTAYNPTVGELQNLGKFLWSDSFDVNTFKKLFNDPFDTLLGLSIIPISPNTSGSKNIMFGNLDSGVSAPVVANQWVTKDMGSVTLKEVWKGALDYAPSTSASIYLPFIGVRQLNINDVMGSTLHLIYKFDVLTGGCIAQIYINHNAIGNKDDGFSWNPNQGLVYEFMGQCSVNIPLASQDFTNTIRSAVSAVGMVAGASASIATGNPVLGIATATVASANLGMQANTPTVERSGHLSGSCAILGYNQPFLVVTRPHQCKPSRYYALRGVPSQVYTSKLSNCTGFTQITANNNIHCSGAQDSELQEIQNLLVSGVYFPDSKR